VELRKPDSLGPNIIYKGNTHKRKLQFVLWFYRERQKKFGKTGRSGRVALQFRDSVRESEETHQAPPYRYKD
jgi:hypothetical protein